MLLAVLRQSDKSQELILVSFFCRGRKIFPLYINRTQIVGRTMLP